MTTTRPAAGTLALGLIKDRLAGHPDQQKIVTLVAIGDGRLPNPKPPRSVLDGYEADGLIRSDPSGWLLTGKGYATISVVWYAHEPA